MTKFYFKIEKTVMPRKDDDEEVTRLLDAIGLKS